VNHSQMLARHLTVIPINDRKGDIIIWDAGQAHCNFPNNSPKCRIYQFVRYPLPFTRIWCCGWMLTCAGHVRMMPALKECAIRDKASPYAVVKKYPDNKFWETVELSPLARKLVGLDPWET
jgi:hypothetical protein